jgi:hypothetical protein
MNDLHQSRSAVGYLAMNSGIIGIGGEHICLTGQMGGRSVDGPPRDGTCLAIQPRRRYRCNELLRG